MTDVNLIASLSSHIAAAVEGVAGAVVAVHARRRRSSSGILWKPGLVVSAAETIERDEDLSVTLPDGRTVAASLVGADPSTDVAVLRVEDGAANTPALTRAEPPRPGSLVLAVGRGDEGSLAALGIVSSAGGAWRSLRGGTIDHLIRLDLALSARAEGGVVIDAAGAVLGMAVYGPRRRALVIPIDTIARVSDHLAAHGRVGRGYLGVSLQPVRVERGTAGTPEARAAMIVGVDADGPARQAGLLLGDIILAFDGEPVHGVRDIYQRLGSDSIGRTVTLDLQRAGAPAQVAVTVRERPAA